MMHRLLVVGTLVATVSCAPETTRVPVGDSAGQGGAGAAVATMKPAASAGERVAATRAETAEEGGLRRSRQVLYVPVYSHVYWGPSKRAFNLACTLSVRNTDTSLPITLVSVDYFDTDGQFVRAYLEQPLTLSPLATKDFYLEESDTAGGSGANFIVRWEAETPVNPPVVEALMIGVHSSQGISFLCPAHEISE